MDRHLTAGEFYEFMTDFRDGMGVAMERMETRLGDRIDSLDHRIDSLDHRVDSLEHRLGERMARMEDRLTVRIDGLESEMHEGFAAVNERIDGLEPPRRRGTR